MSSSKEERTGDLSSGATVSDEDAANAASQSAIVDIVRSGDVYNDQLSLEYARAAYRLSLTEKGVELEFARIASLEVLVTEAALESEQGRNEWVRSATEAFMLGSEWARAERQIPDAPQIALPEPGSGYPIFPGRRHADAEQWLHDKWGTYITHRPGGLDQATLRVLDRKLMIALENCYVGRKAALARLIPNRSELLTLEVKAAGLNPENREHRRRLSIAREVGRRLKK